ncbi:redoxin domain-containing protein [Halorhabdus sp. CUG00001]|uniref:redoxin domain-containing protein n=1 Tax=Halorhabdus sp. CUG00001 TaxID=2600297 RepID=UPI00131C3D99|nr:redoxin domain-containing protein [Halorhabdus sp. CUG00001]
MDLEFDVVEFEATDHVAEGEAAPAFTRPLVNDEYWEDVPLAALLEEPPVVLVFHPMDGSFPATYVWNEIADREWHESATVVGVSISTPYAHKRLIESEGLEAYRLYSDPSNEIAREYGVAHDLDGMAGIEEPRPAVFVLDGEGVVEDAWVATEWPEFPEYDEIEAAIESL